MKSFLKYTLATIVGIIISSIIMVIISFGFIGIIISAGDKPVEVKSNSILHFKIAQPIPDRGSNNPFDGFDFTSFKLAPQTGLDQILKNIEKAKTDDRIKGIYIEAGMYPPGIATIEEIRNALIDFKESRFKTPSLFLTTTNSFKSSFTFLRCTFFLKKAPKS